MSIKRLGMRGVVGRFFTRLEAVTAGDWADKVSFLNPTDQESEEYKWLGQTPAMRKWIGGRQAKGLLENGVIVRNDRFEATLEFDVDDLRRDKSPQSDIRIDEMAGRAGEHWAKLLTELVRTPGNSYDAVSYFNAAHAEGSSGSQRNIYAAAEIPELNVVTANNPTDEEMVKIFLKLFQEMRKIKDDQGEPMNYQAKNFLVMVPPNMDAAAIGALSNKIIFNGSSVARDNPLLNAPYKVEIISNPRLDLSSEDAVIYAFRTDAPAKAFIRQEELLEASLDETKIFSNNTIQFGLKALRGVGTGYWQYAAKATLS